MVKLRKFFTIGIGLFVSFAFGCAPSEVDTEFETNVPAVIANCAACGHMGRLVKVITAAGIQPEFQSQMAKIF